MRYKKINSCPKRKSFKNSRTDEHTPLSETSEPDSRIYHKGEKLESPNAPEMKRARKNNLKRGGK